MNALTLEGVGKSFKAQSGQLDVLSDITLTVQEGQFVTFFGPNGCGKTTLMNIIGGLEAADTGNVKYHTKEQRIAFVFQDFRSSLLPWKTVEENILFPLIIRGVSKKDARKRLERILSDLALEVPFGSRVYDLSGGQAQLACIFRALIIEPTVLILDEPFSALDYHVSLGMRQKLLAIWQRFGFTTLFISHDLDEALYLAEVAVFLSRRPATIVRALPIGFPLPRELKILGSPEFAAVKAAALAIITEPAEG